MPTGTFKLCVTCQNNIELISILFTLENAMVRGAIIKPQHPSKLCNCVSHFRI